MKKKKTLLKGGLLIPMDCSRPRFGDVLFDSSGIIEIAENIAQEYSAEVVDCRKMFVLPGFVQVHVHLVQTLFRGLAEDLKLLDWLEKKIFPLEKSHNRESVVISARIGISELIKSGTTTILDMGAFDYYDAVLETAKATGIRIVGCPALSNLGCCEIETRRIFHRLDELVAKWHRTNHDRIRVCISPRFALSCDSDFMIRCAEYSRRNNLVLHTHAGEHLQEIAEIRRRTGMRNIEYLESIGFLGNNLVLAHCIHLDDREKEMLARSGTSVAHCPSANLKLGSGIADISGMRKKGINIGIGADGAPCNNNLNPFIEMRLAGLLQSFKAKPGALNAEDILKMATINGAKALGMDNIIGSLEVGKRADIVVLDPNSAQSWGFSGTNPFSRIVYSISPSNVRYVFVDGQKLLSEFKLLTIDESETIKIAEKETLKLIERARIGL